VKYKIKFITVTLISILLNLSLAGCWNSRELNSLAFATSMGFDKTENGILLTVQVFNPRAIASQKSVNETSVIVYTEQGKDAMEIIRRMITQSPRKINVTHLQTIVFSEEFAKDGISDVLDFFSREHQFRTDLYFAVAKESSASNILNTLTKLDTNPSDKLFSSIKSSDQVWAGSRSVKIIELTNSIIADGKSAVLTGVEVIENSKDKDTVETLEEMKTDPVQIEGLAVFQKDKFVGWLNEDESKGYNYIMGTVPSTVGYVEDKSIAKVTLEVTGTNTKQKADVLNGKPAINVDIDVNANIEGTNAEFDVTKEENIKKIEKLAEDKVRKLCDEVLEKAQKNLDSDIFGFGEVIHRANPNLWRSLKNNWDQKFTNLPVNLNITYKIRGTGTITKSFFTKEK